MFNNFYENSITTSEVFFTVFLLILFNAPQTVSLIILVLYFGYEILAQKKVVLSMPGWQIYLLLILEGLILGIFKVGSGDNQLYGLIRHIYYVIVVSLCWYFGYDYVVRRNIVRKDILSCYISVTSIIAVKTIIININTILHMGFGAIINNNVQNVRGDLIGGNTILVIGLYFLIFYQKSDKSNFINNNWLLLITIHVLALFSNFSRTAMLDVVILIIFSGLSVNRKIIRRIVISVLFIIIILNIFAPSLINSAVERILSSSTEVNFWNNNWTENNIVWNWRGYEAHCEFLNFLNSNLFTQIFGSGFGASLDVGNYAYLVTGEGTLPFLHNGYFTQLMVFGLSGVVLLICWFVKLYQASTNLIYYKDRYLAHGIIVFIALNTYIDHGLLFSYEQAMVFTAMGSLFALKQLDKHLN